MTGFYTLFLFFCLFNYCLPFCSVPRTAVACCMNRRGVLSSSDFPSWFSHSDFTTDVQQPRSQTTTSAQPLVTTRSPPPTPRATVHRSSTAVKQHLTTSAQPPPPSLPPPLPTALSRQRSDELFASAFGTSREEAEEVEVQGGGERTAVVASRLREFFS